MPNWCTNFIRIQGKEEDIANFHSKWVNKKCMKFQDLVPRPEDQEENWYTWNCENWGTKWDLDDYAEVMDTEILIQANTAWAPPLKFFETVATKYPELTFIISYHEQGMMFCGFVKWNDGVEDTNIHHSYSSLRELNQLFEEYDAEYTDAWWEPTESDLEEEAEQEKEENRSQEG